MNQVEALLIDLIAVISPLMDNDMCSFLEMSVASSTLIENQKLLRITNTILLSTVTKYMYIPYNNKFKFSPLGSLQFKIK